MVKDSLANLLSDLEGRVEDSTLRYLQEMNAAHERMHISMQSIVKTMEQQHETMNALARTLEMLHTHVNNKIREADDKIEDSKVGYKKLIAEYSDDFVKQIYLINQRLNNHEAFIQHIKQAK